MALFPNDRHDYIQLILVTIAILAATAAVGWVLAHAVRGLLVIFTGLLLSVFFVELTQRVSSWTRLSYRWALGLILLATIALTGGVLYFLGTKIATHTSELITQLEETAHDLLSRLRQQPWGEDLLNRLSLTEQSFRSGAALSTAKNAFWALTQAVTAFVIIIFLGFYFSVIPEYYHKALLMVVPPAKRDWAATVIDTIGEQLWWWILGRVVGMVIIGTGSALGLWWIGIPLPFVLGVMAGLLTFIPNIGPTLSLIPPLLFGLEQSPTTALHVLALYGGLQFVESYFLTPLIDQRQVFLPPGITLSMQVILGLLFGLFGIFLATPLTVVLHGLFKEIYVKKALPHSHQN